MDMNKILILTIGLFLIGGIAKIVAQEAEITKTDRRELMMQNRAEIEAIKADASLTDAQKESLIKEKRMELRNQIGTKGRGNRIPDEIKAEVEAISADDTLTDEQKKELVKEKLTEYRKETKGQKGNNKGTIKGDRKGNKGDRKSNRAELKAGLEAINNDPNLTDSEKAEQRQALLESTGAKIREGRNDERRARKGDSRRTYRGDNSDRMLSRVESAIAEGKMTPELKTKTLDRIVKREEALAKELKEGSISQAKYDEAIEKTASIRKLLETN